MMSDSLKKISGGGGNDPLELGKGCGGKALPGGDGSGGAKARLGGDMGGGRNIGKIFGGDAGGGRFSVICFTLGFLLLVGCSIKKNTPELTVGGSHEIALEDVIDSDSDGVSDILESQTGTNPFIADIPKISIALVQDIAIGAIFKTQFENQFKTKSEFQLQSRFSMLKQEFSEVQGEKGGDLETLKVLRKKVIKNQYNHLRNVKSEKSDIITNEDLRSNILSSWTDDLYYPFIDTIQFIDTSNDNDSGKFVTNLKVKISNALNVTEISDVSLKTFFYDYEKMEESEIYNHYLLKSSGTKEKFKLSGDASYSPVTTYPLIANELQSSVVYAKLLERSEIGIKFTDYSYITSGVQLNYAEVLNKVFESDAKIIYSDGIRTEVFFVSPNLTLVQALNYLGKRVKLNKNGEIYSINDIETTAHYPLDVDNLRFDDLKKGIWSVFGDGDAINEKVKAQGLYVVSFSTIEDILKISRRWVDLTESELVDRVILENVYNGDEIVIDVSSIKGVSSAEAYNRIDTPPDMQGAGCNFVETNRGPSCTHIPGCYSLYSSQALTEKTYSTTELQSWLIFEDSYGEKINAKIYKYGKKIKIKFDSLSSHLKNTIKVTFRDPAFLNSSVRVGLIDSTCLAKTPSYSLQTFTNQFKIEGSLKTFGINKY